MGAEDYKKYINMMLNAITNEIYLARIYTIVHRFFIREDR